MTAAHTDQKVLLSMHECLLSPIVGCICHDVDIGYFEFFILTVIIKCHYSHLPTHNRGGALLEMNGAAVWTRVRSTLLIHCARSRRVRAAGRRMSGRGELRSRGARG